jgi:PEGA domain
MFRRLLSAVLVVCVFCSVTLAQSAAPPAVAAQSAPAPNGFVLQDSTPVKLRISRTISSADARTGDQVDFEVLEEVRLNGILIVPKGGSAIGTVTEAQEKRRMGRGGKLDMNIDYVRLADGGKAALRAVKEVKGGGHTGAMTAGIVATSLIVWPAAPFFLFMHGKDITIPKGTEITAYINGDTPLDASKFEAGGPTQASAPAPVASSAQIDVASTPPGADIEIDGKFVGNTPSSITVAQGDHEIAVKKSGFAVWDRKVSVSSGHININAELTPQSN